MAVDPQYKELPFREAIAFMRTKVNLPSTGWADLLRESHDWAFTVAGVTKADVLDELRRAVDKAISKGTTLQEFRKDFDRMIERHGWSYRGTRGWRTQTIYRTNLSTSYSAGRYRQMTDPDVLERRPYWWYRHGDPLTPRETHLSWDDTVLPADDPWWDTHYAPNGWGCSCKIFSLSKADVNRRGLKVRAEAPEDGTYEWADPVTGEIQDIPVGIDPGFDYAPGKTLVTERETILDRTRKRLPPELLDPVNQEIGRVTAPGPTIAVSAALSPPSRGPLKEAAGRALQAIDSVHEDGALPAIPIERTTSTRFRGAYSYERESQKPVHIRIATKEDREIVIAHEVGHFLDHQGLGRPRFHSITDERWEAWRTAVGNSDAVAQLREALDRGAISIPGLSAPGARRWLEYLLDPKELWARSYAQYIAVKSQNEVMLRQLKQLRSRPAAEALPTQWSDEDFVDIVRAIDELFVQLGWI